MAVLGAICFGLVIGWITYGMLRRREGAVGLTGLAAVLAAVGGGAVTALLALPEVFGGYALGLAVGFFGYLVAATLMPDSKWLGD
jgi:H+/Cl- antiporter ClcA